MTSHARRVVVAVAAAVALASCMGSHPSARPRASSPPTPRATVPLLQGTSRAAAGPPVYVHYYLWWTAQHWRDKLGAAYPIGANPLPLPGAMGANGCTATVRYPGASIVDVPAEGLYDQGDPATFDRHIAMAAAAGIRGFVVAWQGTGAAQQSPSASGYDSRLDLLVKRVDAYNATHAQHFNLALGMSAFGDYHRASPALVNDLTYFANRYGSDPAFANDFSPRPLVMILDSRKYTGSQVSDVAGAVGTRLLLISDDTDSTWSRDGRYFAGASWYWSSQNPYDNPRSGTQLRNLASQVHAAGKLWFAPFAPGFDAALNGHAACTPRDGTSTLQKLWQVNRQSQPDAWFGISWNEFVENTYIEPSVAYGSSTLDALHQLIAQQ